MNIDFKQLYRKKKETKTISNLVNVFCKLFFRDHLSPLLQIPNPQFNLTIIAIYFLFKFRYCKFVNGFEFLQNSTLS